MRGFWKNIVPEANVIGFSNLANTCWGSAQCKGLHLTLWGIQRRMRAILGLLRTHSLSVKTGTFINNGNSKANCDKCCHRGINNVPWGLGEGEANLK